MGPERLQQIESIYHAARELESQQRTEFLIKACGTDESLRQEVESLLAYGRGAEFIDSPAMELEAGALASRDSTVGRGGDGRGV